VAAAGLAGFGALVSLALGFLILGEDVAGVVPGRWVAVFVATSVGTFVLLLVAAVTGRRALGLRGWRSAADGRFLWETVLSIVAVVASGLATAVSDRFPGYLCLASILAVYVTLVRWTWWTWRAFG
jgi:hypothetical protein